MRERSQPPTTSSAAGSQRLVARARAGAGAALGALVLALGGCDVGYLARGAYEEGRILWKRRPITQVLASDDLAADTRDKLELVLKVRQFAAEQLGLDVGGDFSAVAPVDKGAIVWVVMAAPRESLRPYEWWFPIVGWVPYRGYFDQAQAQAEALKLEQQQLDTFVRSSVAFSSLGFFNDPVLTNMLALERVLLVGVLIHELFHRTYFLASDVMFDESAANYIGSAGALEFFSKTEGADSADARAAREVLASQLKFSHFLRHEEARLLDLYLSKLSSGEIVARRSAIFEQIKADYAKLKPTLSGLERQDLDQQPINNAVIVNYRIYFHDLDDLAALQRLHQGDLRATIESVIALAKQHSDDPFFAIWQAAQQAPKAPP